MVASFDHFGVVGAGAWGTALAIALKRAGRDVTLGAREPDLAAILTETHENTAYLPKIKLQDDIRITHDLAALTPCKALVLAPPPNISAPQLKPWRPF